MKMVAEYLEYALQFEQLASREQNPQFKADLEKQAAAYRKLATDRAKNLDWSRRIRSRWCQRVRAVVGLRR